MLPTIEEETKVNKVQDKEEMKRRGERSDEYRKRKRQRMESCKRKAETQLLKTGRLSDELLFQNYFILGIHRFIGRTSVSVADVYLLCRMTRINFVLANVV